VSLSDRLNADGPRRSNVGCVTCAYVAGLSKADRAAFDAWVLGGHSLVQLWDACAADDPPLTVSVTALRNHLRHHENLT
jgi:hypothetical protein